MQIILVSRSNKAPRRFDLGSRRMRLRIGGLVAGAGMLFAGVGAALALLLASPRAQALAEIRHMHATIAQQHRQLAEIKVDAQRNVNGLAVKLGELQAQSVRLNALGERLAQAGKLDAGEFNFEQPPSIGGPESGNEKDYALPQSLEAGIDTLNQQFSSQNAQLSALQDLLLDRKVSANLRPTGMPVSGYISSYFGPRTDPITGGREFHTGLDIATRTGTPVHAVAEGIVTYAGVRRGYGNVVEVDHGNGYMTRFAHNSKLLVHPGERVRIGQVLAMSGDTGRSTGPHVHFEVWFRGHPVNPLAYVRAHR